jgi:hypothetical protein
VRGERNSCAATSLLVSPSATSRAICSSCGVSWVRRLWWVPGALLVTAAVLAGRHVGRRDVAAIGPALERNLTRLLTAALGCLVLGLGLTAHGAAAVAGILGGAGVLAVAVAMSRLRPAAATGALVAAVAPFAALTWWSIVTPLLAVLTIGLGTLAARRVAGASSPSTVSSGPCSARRTPPSRAGHVRTRPS